MTQGQGTHAVDVLFYATDHLGSTILAVDANKTIQTRNLYMPFGDPGAVQEGTALRHRYIGGVILEESGLYALGPRLYDPEVGRFLSPDPLVASPTNPQAFNRYSYALNNPVTLSDPSGLAPIYPGMEDPGGNSSSVDYYGPITHSTGSTRGPNYGNLARGCYADGRCPRRPQSQPQNQPQTPAISNPGSPTTQPYAANDVEGSQSGQQGVQYAQSGEFTPEQLAEARRFIANAQNPHPGVGPGQGHDKDWVGPVLAEAYAKAYLEVVGGVAGAALAPGAAGAVAVERVLARGVLATQSAGFRTGLTAGAAHAASGIPGGAPQIPGNASFNAGAKIGSTSFKFVKC